ncbi:PfkB family carbohydrate kinase [Pseudonocardia sp. RS11V-5]|uniref:PfkB family carbohydrate kinase n=1 Tax=Pseudonocardia terrae TaxID=2905831 RepID=UPI001E4D77FE|nr:PfkB family carbohydrate kinase [Pseudonocardia terrae]MCE3553583.1 PfkB family carbohydrate kinase [Pseudonocardia terrae]
MTEHVAPRVVVVGAVNVDMVVRAPRLPGPGETVVGPGVERFGGGKGANAAVAAARAGAEVRYVGAVGADDVGSGAVAELRAEGIDVGAVAVLEGVPTGVALIVVDEAGENQIAVGGGANAAVDPEAVRSAVAGAAGWAGCVLVSTEIPEEAVAAAVESAAAQGIPCVVNSAPVLPVLGRLLRHGPVLTPNATEIRDLAALLPAGDGPATEADRAAALARRTNAEVVVTLGGDGVLVVDPGGGTEHVPAHPVAEVRDTTGAGDTFNGVLAAGLAAGDPVVRAVRRAAVAAALSVAESGARSGMPGGARIEAELAASARRRD